MFEREILPAVRAFVFDPESPARFLGFDAPVALASFALLQWIQLEWPTPDAVIPMPDAHSLCIGKEFAELLDFPFVRALTFDCRYKEDRLEEDQTLLLFDVLHPVELLQKGALALSESFPKRIYLLSLF